MTGARTMMKNGFTDCSEPIGTSTRPQRSRFT